MISNCYNISVKVEIGQFTFNNKSDKNGIYYNKPLAYLANLGGLNMCGNFRHVFKNNWLFIKLLCRKRMCNEWQGVALRLGYTKTSQQCVWEVGNHVRFDLTGNHTQDLRHQWQCLSPLSQPVGENFMIHVVRYCFDTFRPAKLQIRYFFDSSSLLQKTLRIRLCLDSILSLIKSETFCCYWNLSLLNSVGQAGQKFLSKLIKRSLK